MNDSRVIVALDYDDANTALNFVDKVDPTLCKLKVGKELFTKAGPHFVEELIKREFKVFLDLKFHDIPNTVAKACEMAAKLGVWLVDVHASGGSKMMEAAANALANYKNRPLLIGVTVLTSMSDDDLKELGINRSAKEQVLHLAKLAKSSGLDGVVSSANEVELIKSNISDFITVTPGIRPAGSDIGDQNRVMTPQKAIAIGSDYLVIGRPITKASDPLKALLDINESIK